MKRWLFNIAAGVSLVLCVASIGGWMRSLSHRDKYSWNSASGNARTITSDAGWLEIDVEAAVTEFVNPSSLDFIGFKLDDGMIKWSVPAAGNPPGWGVRDRSLLIRYWFLVLTSAVIPLCHIAGRRRRQKAHRLEHGLCLNCGYDLRATPERCPECGTESNRRGAETPRTDAEGMHG